MSNVHNAKNILKKIQHAIRKRSVRQGIENLSSKLEENVPFCSVFRVSSGYALPSDFAPSTYPGLLSCQIVNHHSAGAVIVYWRDRVHADSCSSQLLSDIAVSDRALAGFVVDVKRPVD